MSCEVAGFETSPRTLHLYYDGVLYDCFETFYTLCINYFVSNVARNLQPQPRIFGQIL